MVFFHMVWEGGALKQNKSYDALCMHNNFGIFGGNEEEGGLT